MVVVQLYGGLGNQMFQYAAAYALAVQNSTVVKLDTSLFQSYKLRNFDLAAFNTEFLIASPDEIDRLTTNSLLFRVTQRIMPYSRRRFYKEPFFHFDSSFFKLNSPVYIKGYFQSENYFSAVKKDLGQIFQFKKEFVSNVIDAGEEMANQNSIAVHIRRGDYNNAEAQKVHGTLPLDYYKKAMEKFRTNVESAVFFIFTDDPDYIKQHFQTNDANLISGAVTKTAFEDFYLMTKCKHNIIANSSFSWWAAWLNDNPGKIVMAPRSWFSDGPKDTQDLLPQGWIRL